MERERKRERRKGDVMVEKEIAGKRVDFDDEGYMKDFHAWDEELARELLEGQRRLMEGQERLMEGQKEIARGIGEVARIAQEILRELRAR